MDLERFDRQILLFGREGQDRIGAASVVIAGVGGTGSHVAQQLAFLGVQQFALIDADIATPSSRNRLIGCTPEDVEARKPKVEIARRLIQTIDPAATVTCIQDSFVSEAGEAELRKASTIFGCVDTDGARLLLTEWATAYDRPYIDVATDTDPEIGFGGRIVICREGAGCLFCLGELDQSDIHRSLSPPERRSEEDKIYGIRADRLENRGPSVVSLNGILASLAVMEFLVLVTGQFRPPKRQLRYRGNFGTVNEPADAPDDWCPYCSQRGAADHADWARHVRAGIGKWLR